MPLMSSMEVLLGSSAIQITILFASLFVLLKLVNGRGKRSKAPKLPPGPPKLPIIGNMNQLIGPLPHRLLSDLALKHGELMSLQLGQVLTVVASSSRMAEEIMKTHDVTFASRPDAIAPRIVAYGCSNVGFSPYGPYWRQMRKLCILELLSAKRVQSFQFIREEEVSLLLRSIMSTTPAPFNLTQKLFCLTNDLTARVTFGRRYSGQSEFEPLMKKMQDLAGGFNVADFFPSLEFVTVISGLKFKLESIHGKIDRILSEILEEHREKNRGDGEPKHEDLVDVMLRLQKDDTLEVPLTDDKIKAVLLDMFIAGTDTSSTVMDWAMAELMRNPNMMEKAQKEIRDVVGGKGKVDASDVHELKYLRLVLKETLRFHPPIPLLVPRESMERCTIDGYEIPAKTRVLVNSWAIARDPKHWENAETFNPERFSDGTVDFKGQSFEMVPFGGGRRGCPGILFGFASMEMTLASLLYHFDWKLPSGMTPDELDMSEHFSLVMPRKSNLTVIAIPRFPLSNDVA